MADAREVMDDALKQVVAPMLRERGFKGSFPHYRRTQADGGIDLLSFQFARAGGKFCVNVAHADAARVSLPTTNPALPSSKFKAGMCNNSWRLSRDGHRNNKWFTFNWGDSSELPNHLAGLVNELVATQAEAWWTEIQRGRIPRPGHIPSFWDE